MPQTGKARALPVRQTTREGEDGLPVPRETVAPVIRSPKVPGKQSWVAHPTPRKESNFRPNVAASRPAHWGGPGSCSLFSRMRTQQNVPAEGSCGLKEKPPTQCVRHRNLQRALAFHGQSKGAREVPPLCLPRGLVAAASSATRPRLPSNTLGQRHRHRHSSLPHATHAGVGSLAIRQNPHACTSDKGGQLSSEQPTIYMERIPSLNQAQK